MDRCGSFQVVMDRCGSFLGHCGSLWVIVDRCGSLWVVPCFSNYASRSERYRSVALLKLVLINDFETILMLLNQFVGFSLNENK